MSNMSYCRFRNTLRDLQDCFRALRNSETDMNEDERDALLSLLALCTKMGEEFPADEVEAELNACSEKCEFEIAGSLKNSEIIWAD